MIDILILILGSAKNTLWFVIFMDKTLPSKVDKNIFLLQSNIDKEISP